MQGIETPQTEDEQVRGWRFQCFYAAGFTMGQARRLSNSAACHHEAEHLLAAGCTHELAYQILRHLE